MNAENTGIPGLILALDVDSPAEAGRFLSKCGTDLEYIKIGPALYASGGTAFLKELMDRDYRVFLDLKLHDIPNTVASAVRVLTEYGIWALTLHSCGGRRMLEEAVNARNETGGGTVLLGVSVLTSLSGSEWSECHPECDLEETVLRRADLCRETGLDGVVCSPADLESKALALSTEGMLRVTPGIRVRKGGDDQLRTATPASAAALGATHIVVGRPILKAPDPAAAISEIIEEMERGRK